VGHLDSLLVCCGGGSLLYRFAIATITLLPNCRVIGVKPAQADNATRSFESITPPNLSQSRYQANGARTPSLGQLTFPLVLHYVDQMVTVSGAGILHYEVLVKGL